MIYCPKHKLVNSLFLGWFSITFIFPSRGFISNISPNLNLISKGEVDPKNLKVYTSFQLSPFCSTSKYLDLICYSSQHFLFFCTKGRLNPPNYFPCKPWKTLNSEKIILILSAFQLIESSAGNWRGVGPVIACSIALVEDYVF